VPLLARVVLAERRIERDAGGEEGFAGRLELLEEILRSLRAIDVAADEDDELEWESVAEGGHLLGELVLLSLTGAEIAEDGELQGTGRIRQGSLLSGGWLLRGARNRPDGTVANAADSGQRNEYEAGDHTTLTHVGLLGHTDRPCQPDRSRLFPPLPASRSSTGRNLAPASIIRVVEGAEWATMGSGSQ
jgi:hypothetical protein